GHRVVARDVQAAAGGVAAGAAGADSGAARAAEGLVAGEGAAGDDHRPDDRGSTAAGAAAATPTRVEGVAAGAGAADGPGRAEVPAVDGRRNPRERRDGAAVGLAPIFAGVVRLGGPGRISRERAEGDVERRRGGAHVAFEDRAAGAQAADPAQGRVPDERA